ncbi:hypothetical protein ACUN90_03420, partial [Escherichia sp. SP-MK2]
MREHVINRADRGFNPDFFTGARQQQKFVLIAGGKARVEGMSRELQLEKKDGSKIWTRFALSKVSAEGKVYYLALVRDASVEMAQKEQTRQLIIAVDHLDRPVIVLDP